MRLCLKNDDLEKFDFIQISKRIPKSALKYNSIYNEIPCNLIQLKRMCNIQAKNDKFEIQLGSRTYCKTCGVLYSDSFNCLYNNFQNETLAADHFAFLITDINLEKLNDLWKLDLFLWIKEELVDTKFFLEYLRTHLDAKKMFNFEIFIYNLSEICPLVDGKN